MHELAITYDVLEIALRHAKQAERVSAVNLVIGQLSSMIDDSVQFYWDFISQETKAAGARLNFKRIPATLECEACGAQYGINNRYELACPTCGGVHIRIVTGEEFYVDSIEVEGLADDHADSSLGENSQRE
ncbi:MAG: hydrogenase maturation nickel metallochaperone HypA [Anaerolinea sp.]|nr:hydrogenase maturation nickel metallochaperone HypA [Anaerolinea sp.]